MVMAVHCPQKHSKELISGSKVWMNFEVFPPQVLYLKKTKC